ncbi:hypothetical protein ACQ4PT_032237 [Festuca glaucescens]
MDPTDYLSIRFHFDGEFIQEGKAVYYVGGQEEMSYVERDRLSMDQLWQQLQVHYLVVEGQQLHWLFPGKELHEGLMFLYEENVRTLSKHVTDCDAVDIYVDDPAVDDKEANDWEVEEENCGADEEDDCGDDVRPADSEEDQKKKNVEEGEDNSEDSDFVPADSSSDGEAQKGFLAGNSKCCAELGANGRA